MKEYQEKYQEENKLLQSKDIPTDEHILLYYKMYCKKFEIKYQDTWITDNVQPMIFEEWEKRAKEKTEMTEVKSGIGIVKTGGYQFMIPMTCDLMVGMPPNQVYLRNYDYRKMVEEEMEGAK